MSALSRQGDPSHGARFLGHQLVEGDVLTEIVDALENRSAPSLGNPRYTGSPESHPGSFHLDLRRSVTTIC